MRDRFSKTTQIPNFMKNRPVEAEWFHADRQKDGQRYRHDKANYLFPQFFERA